MKTFTIKSILITILIIITTAVSAENQSEKNQLRWDEKTVRNYMNKLKPPSKYKRTDNEFISIITNTAIANNIEVPTNIFGFTQFLLEFPSTNYEDCDRVLDVFYGLTNEILGDLLLINYTNYYIETQKLIEKITKENTKIITDRFGNICYRDVAPDLQCKINKNSKINLLKCRSQQSLWAVNNIATPELIDKLNKVWINLKKRDTFNSNVYPCFTINPDRFPKEAEDWLFNSPYVKVRERMVSRWLKSKRPEKIEILRRYIKKLEKLPKSDPYFTVGRGEMDKPYIKKIVLKQIKELTNESERQYKRWLEDGKRMPLFYGTYSDRHWEEYKKESEKERKRIYGKYYKPKSKLTEKEKAILNN